MLKGAYDSLSQLVDNWWGVFLFVLSLINWPWQLVALSSPVFITTLLLFFSGVPPLEKKYSEKYRGDKQYQKYKKRTDLLVSIPYRVPLL